MKLRVIRGDMWKPNRIETLQRMQTTLTGRSHNQQ